MHAMSMRPPICEMVSQHICSAASVSFDEPALTDDVTDMRPPNGKTEWTAMRFAARAAHLLSERKGEIHVGTSRERKGVA